jgi:prevent-host-death family protein
MLKRKTITEFRSSLFEPLDKVLSEESQIVTHKNGSAIALVSLSKIEEMEKRD